MTQPEHARQSVREISAGGAVIDLESELKLISSFFWKTVNRVHDGRGCGYTLSPGGLVGRVSTGLMHATEGVIKSDKSSTERIALMVKVANVQYAADSWD